MMRTTSNLVKAVAVLSALLPFCSSGFASIVYDDSDTSLNRTYGENGTQFGDQITLAPGADRTVTDFQFEYFLSQNASGNETVQLSLYKNDGTGGAPSSLLYTSPVLSLQTGHQVADLSAVSIQVPDTFTWAVTFNGIDANEVAGLYIAPNPSIGSSFDDFWKNNGGTWNTYLFPDGTAANFAARVTAVPEPTTLAFGLLAGLGSLGYLGLKRRSA